MIKLETLPKHLQRSNFFVGLLLINLKRGQNMLSPRGGLVSLPSFTLARHNLVNKKNKK